MTINLPPLPYEMTALEPYISSKTLEIHHGKHHQAYVANLNALIESKPLQPLEEIIQSSSQSPEQIGIFNNAAQVWNHTFFWSSMKPSGGGEPKGALLSLIQRDMGGMSAFREAFKKAALSQFGSGWAWLVQDKDGTVKVTKTSNADLPLVHGQRALIGCDVWEHAYYLDYQNRRADFVDAFLTHLINWDFASANLEA